MYVRSVMKHVGFHTKPRISTALVSFFYSPCTQFGLFCPPKILCVSVWPCVTPFSVCIIPRRAGLIVQIMQGTVIVPVIPLWSLRFYFENYESSVTVCFHLLTIFSCWSYVWYSTTTWGWFSLKRQTVVVCQVLGFLERTTFCKMSNALS